MKLFSKDTDYAVRVIMRLAVSGDIYVSSKELSEQLEIPYQFLRSVVQKLKRAGMLDSKEGIAGGVRFTGSADKVSVADIIRVLHGKVEVSDCMFRNKICSNRGTCPLRRELLRIEDVVTQEFDKLTIAYLLKKVTNV